MHTVYMLSLLCASGGHPEALRGPGGLWNPLSGPPPGVPAGCTTRGYSVSIWSPSDSAEHDAGIHHIYRGYGIFKNIYVYSFVRRPALMALIGVCPQLHLRVLYVVLSATIKVAYPY